MILLCCRTAEMFPAEVTGSHKVAGDLLAHSIVGSCFFAGAGTYLTVTSRLIVLYPGTVPGVACPRLRGIPFLVNGRQQSIHSLFTRTVNRK